MKSEPGRAALEFPAFKKPVKFSSHSLDVPYGVIDRPRMFPEKNPIRPPFLENPMLASALSHTTTLFHKLKNEARPFVTSSPRFKNRGYLSV
jgi:hypothetical protein